MKTVYWCRCAAGKNFGDALGMAIAQRYAGTHLEWAPAASADAVLIGSILEHLPERYTGTVAGIGAARASTRRDLTNARVIALRGPLTRKQVELFGPEPVQADPGLLADDFLTGTPTKTHETGAIAHYADKTFNPEPGALIIDVTAPIETVVAQAASCGRIQTSSLHGIILADALGLPRRWDTYPKVQGGGHKHRDYAASLGQTITPGEWKTAPADLIAEKKQQLREALRCMT